MAQWTKSMVILASQMDVSSNLIAPPPIQLPANSLGKAESDGLGV